MRDMSVQDGRIGFVNRLVAAGVAVVCAAAMLVWGVPGIDPSLWEELAVVAGLRPPQAIFPGFWRLLVGWVYPLVGAARAVDVLTCVGVAVGGVCVYSFCLIVRQILALTIRIGRPYRVWYGFIAPFFAAVAAFAFGMSDPLWRVARTFSPDEIRLLFFLGIVHGSLRWFTNGGRWRLFPVMAAMGLLAAETPFAFLLPTAFIVAYVTVWHCVLDGLFPKPEKFPEPSELPKWRMFFLFLGGLGVGVWANVSSFVLCGGMEASGWELDALYFRYAGGYWHVFADAATIVGWALGLCFCILPFLLSLRLAPLVIRDDRQMPFNIGVMMFLVGILATMQVGAFSATRFWTFSSDFAMVSSGFLLSFFVFAAMIAFAVFGASFAFECQRLYLTEETGKAPGVLLRYLVPAIAVGLLALIVRHAPKSAESEMQRIVDEAIRQTVEECGDAKWLFTDGHLDAAIELEAAVQGKDLTTLNMMAGGSDWEVNLRKGHFKPESEDYKAAEAGVPALLRIWAGERPGGMDKAALQLGFDLWRRERKPMPTAAGLVARTVGMDDATVSNGVRRANALAKRILDLAPAAEAADPSPTLADAYAAVNWRLSRFARLRNDRELADGLDECNSVLRQMITLVEQERTRTFMQMTPLEGLQIALRRANFAEARRYAMVILASDEEHAAANFAMGMNELQRGRLADAERYLARCLIRRPKDPAVLNNLSIICRKQGKYKEALDYAQRAIALLPDTPEIKQTLADAIKKAP